MLCMQAWWARLCQSPLSSSTDCGMLYDCVLCWNFCRIPVGEDLHIVHCFEVHAARFYACLFIAPDACSVHKEKPHRSECPVIRNFMARTAPLHFCSSDMWSESACRVCSSIQKASSPTMGGRLWKTFWNHWHESAAQSMVEEEKPFFPWCGLPMFSLLGVFYKSLIPNLKFTTASHTSCVPTDSLWHTVKPCAMSYAAITLQLFGGWGGRFTIPAARPLPGAAMLYHHGNDGTLLRQWYPGHTWSWPSTALVKVSVMQLY